MIEWKLFGKVVHNPILVVISVIVTVILGLGALALSPALVPLHFVIRKLGYNGFYFNRHVCIGKESFARD